MHGSFCKVQNIQNKQEYIILKFIETIQKVIFSVVCDAFQALGGFSDVENGSSLSYWIKRNEHVCNCQGRLWKRKALSVNCLLVQCLMCFSSSSSMSFWSFWIMTFSRNLLCWFRLPKRVTFCIYLVYLVGLHCL